MPNKGRISGYISITAGGVLCLAGIGFIGVYVYSVIQALDTADRSVIYWYLVFVFTGLTLIGFGIYFIIIGYRAMKDSRAAELARNSLMVLGAVITFLFITGIYNQLRTNEWQMQHTELEKAGKKLEQGMHKITRLNIEQSDENGFRYSYDLTGNIEGHYTLATRIYNRQADFFTRSEMVTLSPGTKNITGRISFERMFEKCFDEYANRNIYVCIDNSGAESIFTLEVNVTLTRTGQKNVNALKEVPNIRLESSRELDIRIDTFTRNQRVIVKKFSPFSP